MRFFQSLLLNVKYSVLLEMDHAGCSGNCTIPGCPCLTMFRIPQARARPLSCLSAVLPKLDVLGLSLKHSMR